MTKTILLLKNYLLTTSMSQSCLCLSHQEEKGKEKVSQQKLLLKERKGESITRKTITEGRRDHVMLRANLLSRKCLTLVYS